MKRNCPSNWNDGETSRGFRDNLRNPRLTLKRYGVLADSSFLFASCIVTPLKRGNLERAVAQGADERKVLAVKKAVVSLRQDAEWDVCRRRLYNSIDSTSTVSDKRTSARYVTCLQLRT
ncbi:hypothetical protein PsorP6_015881 [Peronosclerospora sorghi]|uniref:Uncharacterized protein n=1 Tax=Peronosclerospora sorghi TaxID=230839 RepID=A0ACC0WQG5_9STRA|nr:hypothetical protein PsorP6_015881 [Peronosclerospora sorghi]